MKSNRSWSISALGRRTRFAATLGNCLNWLIPGCCLMCGSTNLSRALCFGCAQTLPRARKACVRCAMPIDHSDDVCLSCRLSPPAFESGLSAFLFASPVTELIYQLKFRHSMVVGRALGEGLADRVTQCVASIPNIVIPDVVIPVPLHASRVRERGFNQSVEIARPVAERLRIPLVCRAVSRTVATPAQSLLMTRPTQPMCARLSLPPARPLP